MKLLISKKKIIKKIKEIKATFIEKKRNKRKTNVCQLIVEKLASTALIFQRDVERATVQQKTMNQELIGVNVKQ